MKICRYELSEGGPIRIGIVEGDRVKDVSAIADELPTVRWPYPPGDLFIARLATLRAPMEALARRAGAGVPISQVRLKCPVANPGKFICGVGNFSKVKPAPYDPRSLGLLFKMTSAAVGAGDGVTLRWPERETAHEMEIAIVIGKAGTAISAADALDHVAGYAIGLDMTLQGTEFPSFCKSFDSYGVIGPWLVTADEIPDPAQLTITLKVNGELRQQESLGDLILSVPELIEHTASIMTLHPGDVIFSGTPPWSVAPVVPGDTMTARIDRIGEMTVRVHAPPPRTPT